MSLLFQSLPSLPQIIYLSSHHNIVERENKNTGQSYLKLTRSYKGVPLKQVLFLKKKIWVMVISLDLYRYEVTHIHD